MYIITMDAKHTISTSEARKRIFEITKDVQAAHRVYTLTENGKPKAVILSAEEYESLVETLDVLRTYPEILEEGKEIDAAIRSGEWKKWDRYEPAKVSRALSVAEKGKKKYGIHSRKSPKSNKGVR